jgi:protease IV
MRSTYDLFVKRVAEGRSSTPKDIDAIAQGRVWTGLQAHELGLVDELGGLDRAIEIARERAKFNESDNVQLVVYPPKRTFYDLVANPLGVTLGATMDAMSISRKMPGATVVEAVAQRLSLFRRGESLMLMPNIFVREP